jgi:ceramide glucosyltransferase
MDPADLPHVTVIRPVSGLDPRLYECLASSLRQSYPPSKLANIFCVASRADPALPILERLCREFPDANVRITVEDEDPLLLQNRAALGPNPKIRNMSRAYREAEGDVVWILDCNVWVGRGVCGRFIDLLFGWGASTTKYKFVHQTPLSVDLDSASLSLKQRKELLSGQPDEHAVTAVAARAESTPARTTHTSSALARLIQRGGARLDEAFLSSAHAKFYQAINTVAVAPCIMGKSTMFRRSQLNYVTSSNPARAPGIDFFSDNICEDHLIGDALWKQPQAFEKRGSAPPAAAAKKERWGKHEMLFGDLCFQPISHTSLPAYLARRIRWLRVRKYTVTLATFVEPGTESILCGLYGAWGLTTLPALAHAIPQTWAAFAALWLAHMAAWAAVDYTQYLLLHSAKTVEIDAHTPDFVLPARFHSTTQQPTPSTSDAAHQHEHEQPTLRDGARRSLPEFLAAWLGREVFALPVWIVAFWGGATVEWRGKKFWVGLDMKVREIEDKKGK